MNNSENNLNLEPETNQDNGNANIDLDKTIIMSPISNTVETPKKSKVKRDKSELLDMIEELEKSMKEAAANLDFERAMELRDALFELKSEL